MPDYLIYGANGYTGSLIAHTAVARGHRPILAGRNADAVAALGRGLSLEHRAFPLDNSPHGERFPQTIPITDDAVDLRCDQPATA